MMQHLRCKRLIYFIILLATLFFVIVLPSIIVVQTPQEQQATQHQNDIQAQQATAASIFNNNLLVAGISLIPFLGWGYLLYVLWNTGIVIASYGHPWYWIFNNTFAWIELAVYSYMVLQSWKLYRLGPQFRCNDFKVTFIKTMVYSMITAILILLASALLEYAVISRVVPI